MTILSGGCLTKLENYGVGWGLTSTCTPGMEIPGGVERPKAKVPPVGVWIFSGTTDCLIFTFHWFV